MSLIDAKSQFSGHETFPCRYGWLKKAYDSVGRTGAGCNPFAPEVGATTFGVGRNMVASIRHWALACGVVSAVEGRSQGAVEPADLGRLIFDGSGDPFLEEPASVWLLHWRLVRAPTRATCWYFAFNEFDEAIFTKESLLQRLSAKVQDSRTGAGGKAGRVSAVTLGRDVDCLIRSYVAKGGRVTEDGLESPFSEMRLLGRAALGGGAIQFQRGPKPTLPDEVFAVALAEFWRDHYPTRSTMSAGTVAHAPGSPGRAFLLDEESVVRRLGRLAAVTRGGVAWDEGSGLRQLSLRADLWADPLSFARPLYDQSEARGPLP